MSDVSVHAYSDRIISLTPLGTDAYDVVLEIGEGRIVEFVCRVVPANCPRER